MEPVRRDSPEQAALMLIAGAVHHVDAQARALSAETSDRAAALVYSSLMQVRGALAMAGQTAEGYEAARQAGRHERDAEITGLRQRITVAGELCSLLAADGDCPPEVAAAARAVLAILGGTAEAANVAMLTPRQHRRRARHLAAVPGAAAGSAGLPAAPGDDAADLRPPPADGPAERPCLHRHHTRFGDRQSRPGQP